MKQIHIHWPDNRKFALCLTHDVDRVQKKWWHCAYYLLKTGNPYHLVSLFNKGRERPYWNFDKIVEIEKNFGVFSTFFFLNETKRVDILKPSSYKLTFGNYNIKDPDIVEVIKTLDSGGWEIGVHGSYDSYLNKELLLTEKATLERILGKSVLGIRQHFLNLEIPRTWELQCAVGFKYDVTFGSRDKVGFRDEMDIPFRPLDIPQFLAIPLTIMDGPLFEHSDNVEDAWRKCKELIVEAEGRGALLTVLWHNNAFNEEEYPGRAGLYEKIIQECKTRGAWIARCCDIFEWCSKDEHWYSGS